MGGRSVEGVHHDHAALPVGECHEDLVRLGKGGEVLPEFLREPARPDLVDDIVHAQEIAVVGGQAFIDHEPRPVEVDGIQFRPHLVEHFLRGIELGLLHGRVHEVGLLGLRQAVGVDRIRAIVVDVDRESNRGTFGGRQAPFRVAHIAHAVPIAVRLIRVVVVGAVVETDEDVVIVEVFIRHVVHENVPIVRVGYGEVLNRPTVGDEVGCSKNLAGGNGETAHVLVEAAREKKDDLVDESDG